MTKYALVLHTEDGHEHISNSLDGITNEQQAQDVLHALTDQDQPVEWVSFPAGQRHVAIPLDTVTYLAVAPDLRGEEPERIVDEDGREVVEASFTIAAGAGSTIDYVLSACYDSLFGTGVETVHLSTVTIDVNDQHVYTVTARGYTPPSSS